MAPPDRVLVIGGAGVFGSRLVAGLLERTGFTVIVAGRDRARLNAAHWDQPERVRSLVLDARTTTADALRATGAFALVDAFGPFQNTDYRLAWTAIEAGMHYVDLADARDFVAGFHVLDAAAKQAGIVALTGASTTPALSNAVLDMLTAGWTAIDHVQIAISPGNRAPRGLSVIRSILSYAGRPVRLFIDGRWSERPGWGMTTRRWMPGLGHRFLSLAETPDLDMCRRDYGFDPPCCSGPGWSCRCCIWGCLRPACPCVPACWPRLPRSPGFSSAPRHRPSTSAAIAAG